MWVKLIKLLERLRVAAANVSQEIFCLMFELIQIGTNWKLADGFWTIVLIRHTSLLILCPLSAIRAKGGSHWNLKSIV